MNTKLLILSLILLGTVGCTVSSEAVPGGQSVATPTEVNAPLPSVEVRVVQGTSVPPATLTAVPTSTRGPTDTPEPTEVPPTATVATVWPTWTNTPAPTAAATETQTAVPTNTPEPTEVPPTATVATVWPTATPVPPETPTAMPTATVVAAGGSTIPFGTPPQSFEALVSCLAPIYITPSYEMVEWTDQNGYTWHYERGNVATVDPASRTVTFVNGVTIQYEAPGVFLRYQRQNGNWWEVPDNWQVVPQLFTWEQALSAIQMALSQGKVVGLSRVTDNGNTLLICHAH